MRKFTSDDIQTRISSVNGEVIAYISGVHDSALVDKPLSWQLAGRSETASGYGRKLTSRMMINYEGRLHRLYATCYGNSASMWFKSKGIEIIVS